MKALWLFVHFAGLAFWIGGGIAAMTVARCSRREDRAGLRTIARTQAAIVRKVIAPGAVLVVLSGLVLTLRMMDAFETGMSHWLLTMQGAGLLGALLTLIFSLPMAGRIGRTDPEVDPEKFDALRTRLALVGSIAGVLAWIALFAGVAYRTGL